MCISTREGEGMIEDKELAAISEANIYAGLKPLAIEISEFKKLSDYSASNPTGIIIGKRWRSRLSWKSKLWMVREYAESKDPTCAKILNFRPVIHEDGYFEKNHWIIVGGSGIIIGCTTSKKDVLGEEPNAIFIRQNKSECETCNERIKKYGTNR